MKQPLVRRHIVRPYALMICFLLLLLVIAPGLLAQKAVWPNCNFNCTAKDVVLTRAYAETTGEGCTEGAPVTAKYNVSAPPGWDFWQLKGAEGNIEPLDAI